MRIPVLRKQSKRFCFVGETWSMTSTFSDSQFPSHEKGVLVYKTCLMSCD